jgi:hypothetical protein
VYWGAWRAKGEWSLLSLSRLPPASLSRLSLSPYSNPNAINSAGEHGKHTQHVLALRFGDKAQAALGLYDFMGVDPGFVTAGMYERTGDHRGVTRNPKPVTRSSKTETRSPKPEIRNLQPFRNPKPEIRNPKFETQNPKPETRDLKFETWNPKPET